MKLFRQIFSRPNYPDLAAVSCILLMTAAFFYKSLLFGSIPAPTDALVGLYHPYRDLYASEYPNGRPFKNFLITDPVRQQIPWKKSVIESFRRGAMPVWDATSFSGTPLLANIQSGAFYPLNLLFFIFPFSVAWTWLVVSQVLLAGLFFYLFMRLQGLNSVSSLFGAVVFSFCGTSVAWLTWGTILSAWLWTPLSLSAARVLISGGTQNKIAWTAVLILSVVFSFFAGHLQIFFYSCIVIVAYTIWLESNRKNTRHTMAVAGIGFAVLLLVSHQLIAVLRWLPLTARISSGGAWQTDGFFIPLRHFVMFIAPDFFGNPATLNYWGTWNYGELTGYVGVVGLAFALIGLSRKTGFWIVTCLFALFFSVDWPGATIPYVLHIPFISGLQPTRLLFVLDLCLSVLAAYGFSFVYTKRNAQLPKVVVYSIGVALLLAWFAYFAYASIGISVSDAAVIKRNLFFPTAVYAVFCVLFFLTGIIKNSLGRFILSVLVIFLLSVDLFRFGWKFTPFTDRSLFFPETTIIRFLRNMTKPFRIMTTDDRILPPNTHTYYGIESVSGYDPLYSARYERFIAAMERGRPDISEPFGFERIIVPKNYNSPLFNLLNVRYILSFSEIPVPSFRKILTEGETKLYENTSGIPRAYLAEKVFTANTDQEIFDFLYSKDFNYRTDIVSERPIDLLNFPLTGGETVNVLEYLPDKIVLSVRTSQPRVLVLGNLHNPGWSASVNGITSDIFRINYLFMGILVPAGSHQISFQYR